MTRVLMTADAVGGVWTYALELARALSSRGIHTVLATMGPAPSPDQIADAGRVDGLELVTSGFALEWMDDPWTDVRAAGEWLLRLEARVRPWAVHLNGYAHGVLPFRAPAVVVGHSCVASWDEAVGGTWTPTALAAYRQSAGAGLRAAAWVVAPTAAMLAALQRHYGPLDRASVIPNGRDAARFVVGPKEPFVLAAGRLWDRAKNVDAVRRIAKRLSWRVMIAGDRSIGVGRLSEPELRDCLARAAIFALPARYEPFGLLPLEAALSGCALVLGDIASLREVWGDAAVYVEPDNDRALAGAIESLIACPDCLGECASAARHRAAVYTPAAMADGYVALYQAVQPQPVVRRPRVWATTGVVRCAS